MSEVLKGFTQHGVHFYSTEGSQAHGVCPFCGKDKFFANPTNLLWDCKVCIISGNFAKFLERRHQQYLHDFKGGAVIKLSQDRGIKPQTFTEWKVGYDVATGQYMVPMDGNASRAIKDIHKFTIKGKAYSTSDGKLQLFCPTKVNDTQRVWIAEGEWDAMALWECLRAIGVQDDVYGSPGAGTFPKDLIGLLQGKDICIVFDNDKPGRKGAKRTGELFSGVARFVQYLHWPSKDKLPDGFDIRDLYTNQKGTSPVTRDKVYEYVVKNLNDLPPNEPGLTPASTAPKVIRLIKTLDRDQVLEKYRKWLHINNPEVLDVLFGSAFANRINIDPLWVFFVAPSGGSKSELLMSLSDAQKIMTTTCLTAPSLISGANFGGGGDPSLIPKLHGKILIVKDFTTILTMNSISRDEIFGILRDAYDGKIEKQFGNGVSRNYTSRFGILAGVTPVIEGFSNNSVLGERFIKYKIKQHGKINVGEFPIKQAIKNMLSETTMRKELRLIAKDVLDRDILPTEMPDVEPILKQIVSLAQYVAALRGVVSRERFTQTINFKPVSEIGTRLAKQLCALAMGIAIYKREKTITDETLATVVQVAKDTAPDKAEEIVKQMFLRLTTQERSTTQDLCEWTKLPFNTVQALMEDLNLLHVIKKEMDIVSRKSTWRLNQSVVGLINRTKMYERELSNHIRDGK